MVPKKPPKGVVHKIFIECAPDELDSLIANYKSVGWVIYEVFRDPVFVRFGLPRVGFSVVTP